MYRKISFFLLFNIFVVSLFAQHSYGGRGAGNKMPAICQISGSVVDSTTNLAIEYASISVLNNEGKVITGGVSDRDGLFHIREIPPGHYDVKIEFMGFEPHQIEKIELSMRGQRSRDLGQISLTSTFIQIDAINVIEDKPIFENKIDKKVYNVSQLSTPTGGTGEDILNSVPAVNVDMDGGVTLRGNGNVRILVNGKPSALINFGDAVDNLPADMIEKVEVITSPSAKYDPDGMAGIINIVLKKGLFEGFNGDINLTIGERDKYNGSANLNYFNGKFNLFANTSYKDINREGSSGSEEAEQEIGEPKLNTKFINNSTNRHKIGNVFTLGGDYYLNDQNSFSGSYSIISHDDTKIIIENKQLYDSMGVVDGNPQITEIVDEDDGIDHDMSISYYKDFAMEGHELSFDFQQTVHSDKKIEINNEGEGSGENIFNLEKNIKIVTVDYTKPFEDGSIFEAGSKLRNQTFDQEYSAEVFPYHLDFSENILSAYATYSTELSEKLGVKGGIRFESVSLSLNLEKTPDGEYDIPAGIDGDPTSIIYQFQQEALNTEIFELPNYSKFYPSVHLMYAINEENSIKLGYSYRIERPWLNGLNPFPRDTNNDDFVRIGNPNLQPEYTHAIEFDFTKKIGRNSFSSSFYYNKSTDLIHWWDSDRFFWNEDEEKWKKTESSEDYDEVKKVYQADNYGKSQRIGADLSITYFPLPLWFTMVSSSIWASKLDDENVESDLQGNTVGVFTFFMNRLYLPFGQIELTGRMFGPMKTTTGYIYPVLGMDMAIQKSFGKFDVTFKVKNLLDNAGFKIDKEEFDGSTTYFDNFYHYRESRTFFISLKYKFGKVEEKKRKQKKRNGYDRGDDEGMRF